MWRESGGCGGRVDVKGTWMWREGGGCGGRGMDSRGADGHSVGRWL